MSIREPIILDASPYKKGLNEANVATIKFARKQEKAFGEAQRSMKANQRELDRLRIAREAANNPKIVRKFDDTIQKLEKDQRKLRNETERYSKSVKKTGTESQNAAKKTTSSFKSIGQSAKLWLAGAVATAALAVSSALRSMFDEAFSFDKKMRESLAIMRDVSKDTRAQMKKTAREVADDLNISATKVAESYYFLASAGLDARQSIAALPAVAEFAKAGMFDMATATDLATDAQSALGLKSANAEQNLKNLRRVTDVLVNANQDANASVEQFAESLTNRAAAALRGVNKDMEEGVGILAAFADQGEKGQRAGELLSRIIRILGQAASRNTEEFKKLNLIDTEGNFNSLANIIEILTKELDGLSDTQKASRLEQLGFTAEVQDAIKPLLGASDAIREYTKSAYAAGGATKEVAENQMVSLQDRLGKLWTGFKNTFGPGFITLLDDAITWTENLASAVKEVFDSIAQDQTSKMIEALESVGGSPELIARLKKQQAIVDARDIKEELEGQLGSLTIPIDIDEKTFMNKVNAVMDPLFSFRLQGIIPRLKDLREGLEGVGKDKKLSLEKFDTKDIKRYESILADAKNDFQTLSTTITAMQEAGGTAPLGLINQVELYQDQIIKMSAAIDKARELKAVEDSIFELRTGSSSNPPNTAADADEGNDHISTKIDYIKEARREYEKFLSMQRELGDLTTPIVPRAGLDNAVGLIKSYEEVIDQIGSSDVIQSHIDSAANSVERYKQRIVELNNELNAGNITQQQYNDELQKLGSEYLDQLKNIYNVIKDQLGPEGEKAFETIFGSIEDISQESQDVNKSLENFADTLGKIAGMAEGLANIGEELGIIGEKASETLRGISQAAEGGSKLAAGIASGDVFSIISGGIQSLGGIAKIFGGLRGQDAKSAEEVQRLRDEMKSLKREIAKNTEAILKDSIIGGGLTQQQIDKATGGIAGILEALNTGKWQDLRNDDPGGGFLGLGGGKQRNDAAVNAFIDEYLADFLADIQESGVVPDEFSLDNLRDYAYSIGGENLSGSEFNEALDDFLNGGGPFGKGLIELLAEIEPAIGEFGKSLEGATERLNIEQQLGVEGAFRTYIDQIQALIGNVDDDSITNLLEQIQNTDSEKERKELANEIWEAFKNREGSIGSILGDQLSTEDLQAVIDTILGQQDATGSSSDDGFSRSVQIGRSLTEIQANELTFLSEAQLYTLRNILDALIQGFNSIGGSVDVTPSFNGSLPSFKIPVPLPVRIVGGLDEPGGGGIGDKIGDVTAPGHSKSYNFGDINLGGGVTEYDIDELTRKLSEKLKQEIRGKRF